MGKATRCIVFMLIASWCAGASASDLGAALLRIYGGDAGAQAEGIAVLERSAASPDPATARDAEYLLGALRVFGETGVRTPIKRDLAKAAGHFERAAKAGDVIAMAYMAELEISAGHPWEAMEWTQAYLHYSKKSSESTDGPDGYGAGLLHRASLNLNKARRGVSRGKIRGRLNAFIAAHGAGIEVGLSLPRMGWLSPDLEWRGRSPKKSINPDAALSICPATLIEYFFAVSPEGRIRDLHVISSLPCTRAAESLQRAMFEGVTFNAVSVDGPRYGYLQTNFRWQGSDQPKLKR